MPEPGNPQSLNRYAYVNNNPLRYTDPTGHCIPGKCQPAAFDPKRHNDQPLPPRQLALVRQSAHKFGIPVEFLAAVVQTQKELDYGFVDRFEDATVKAALLIFTLEETAHPLADNRHSLAFASSVVLVASTLNSSLGLAQVRISTAREMEEKFAPLGLLIKSESTLDIIAKLETEQGNIDYVAAHLRYLAEQRTGRNPPSFRDLTVTDMQIIYGAYRAGIDEGYGSPSDYRLASQPGEVGRLLSESVLSAYQSDQRLRRR